MSKIKLKLSRPINDVEFDIDENDVNFIELEKAEAFKIVLEELKKYSLFCGEYDAKYGNEHFMYGIQTVMESIAARADDTDVILNNFTDEFLHNMVVSEKKAEYLKLKKNAKEKKKEWRDILMQIKK